MYGGLPGGGTQALSGGKDRTSSARKACLKCTSTAVHCSGKGSVRAWACTALSILASASAQSSASGGVFGNAVRAKRRIFFSVLFATISGSGVVVGC